MNVSREQDVVGVLVSLAGSMVTGEADVVELLAQLTSDCARLLDVAEAGLLLADHRAVLHVMAASSELAAHVEAMQVQRAEGPCLECYHGGRPVHVPDLEDQRDRWPQFVPTALAAGFASVHAVPMRLRDTVLGSLGLFGASAGQLNDADLDLAQGMADVASIALVQERAASDTQAVNDQLQQAPDQPRGPGTGQGRPLAHRRRGHASRLCDAPDVRPGPQPPPGRAGARRGAAHDARPGGRRARGQACRTPVTPQAVPRERVGSGQSDGSWPDCPLVLGVYRTVAMSHDSCSDGRSVTRTPDPSTTATARTSALSPLVSQIVRSIASTTSSRGR